MPSRYVVRSFAENSHYHVFNRGGEKRKIFQDHQDYKIFQYYLFIYLAPLKIVLSKYPLLPPRLQSKNLNGQLDLLAYCLMPNHFHLLLRQVTVDAVSRFMRQLTDAYTRYFNTKYNRTGGLVEGRFKAVPIESDNLLVHVSRYIHLNPLIDNLVSNLKSYPWSSYPEYVGIQKNMFTKIQEVLSLFASSKDYESFVLDQIDYAKELDKIKHLTIDTN